MYLKFRYSVFLLVLIIYLPIKNFAQIDKSNRRINSTTLNNQAITDTAFVPDTIQIRKKNKSENVIEAQVIYKAQDSVVLSRDQEKVYLYKDARVEYGDIVLEADYIEYDQKKNYVFARGVVDSLGNLNGKPQFKDKGDEFSAKTIKYNFKTKKGYIEEVFTEEEQGFLHSEQTNKLEDNSFLLKNGKYTTCDLEDHPHFYLKMSKAKVIPNDKIISGPAYLVMQDIPFKFLGVPFGFFPNQSEYSSGIMIPKYGEEKNRGFFLQDGGYYFGISDKMDLAVTGDIFSKGSWGGDINYRFRKRYKFNTVFNFSYAEFVKSEKGLPDYLKSKDMSIRWTHTQDPKANPNTKFSASVNYSTSSYDQFNSQTIDERAINTKSSSITYGKNWPGSPFRFNMNLKHSQNSNTNNVSLTLPVITLNMDRQYPFRSKKSTGDTRWYEDIEVQYSSKFENRINTADSLLFNGTKWSDFDNGFQHTIPLSTNFKILQYFNLSPKVEYTGILFTNYLKTRYYDNNAYDSKNNRYGMVQDVEANSMKYAQLVEPSISLSVGPNIYGMYGFNNPDAKVIAVRHVVTPSAGISFRPDMGSMVEQYYGEYTEYQNGSLVTKEYSIFDNELYNFPAAPGKSGSVSLGLNNTLEMKVRSDKDTTNTAKKIKLLESFKLSTSYNLFADSLNWSKISISGRTSMFENKLSFNFGASLDPYAINETGRRYNQFYWDKSDGFFLSRLGRLERIDFSIDIKLNSRKREDNNNETVQTETFRDEQNRQTGRYQESIQDQIVTYVDFDIPWNIGLNYKFVYSKPQFEKNVTQTMSLSGNISLTKKWKISFRANYDLVKDKLSSTSININRDLHCWEMTFSWIPVGYMQSYNFQINVKGSTLRDFLKYHKRKSWQDNL